MSVTTTSDMKITEAKDHIKQAIRLLLEATDDDTWGSSEYSKEYADGLEESLLELRKIKRKL